MTRPHVPQEVLDAAHARRSARHARDWAEADRLKALIEAAGWRVVDRGGDFALSPIHPEDVVDGGRTRFGWSGAVPSRLADPDDASADTPATVVARVRDVAALARARSLVASAPAGTRLVAVVDTADDAARAVLAATGTTAEAGLEVVWLAGPGGLAAAWNAGLRRATGTLAVLAGDGVEADGDAIGPLVVALADEAVAVAGARALAGPAVQDLAPGDGRGAVAAVDDLLLAMRRADAAARGPLDERYATPMVLAAWWSLTLRDGASGTGGAEAGDDHRAPGLDAGVAPQPEARNRAAIALPDLPVRRSSAEPLPAGEREQDDPEHRLKRDRYRILDAFRDRPDLLEPGLA